MTLKARVVEMWADAKQSENRNNNLKPSSLKRSNIDEGTQPIPIPDLEPGALWCPVVSCGNNGGKGYKKLLDHLHRSHSRILQEDGGEDKMAIINTIQKLNRWICAKCKSIKARVDEKDICTPC